MPFRVRTLVPTGCNPKPMTVKSLGRRGTAWELCRSRNPSNHDRKMVRGDSATGPRNLLAAYGAIPKCKVELRTSTKLLFLLYNLVRSERFERPTLRFVV